MKLSDYIEVSADKFDIKLTDSQIKQLENYYRLLIEWNNKINLTAITEEEGVAVKHFADSMSVLKYIDIPQSSTLIDVGTGAGFPGMVLKIVRPDLKLTLLDSLNKRLVFLKAVADSLSLDVQLIHSRAEDGGNDLMLRESFDFVVSRAVAQLNVLCEYCIPFARLGGKFIAYKGYDSENEFKTAKNAVNTLGGKIIKAEKFELPFNCGGRSLIIIEKERPTPDRYPRISSKIKSKPL